MKTATHGPDEGRLDLQKSVLIRGAKSFASPPQPSRTMATPKVLRVRHSPPARWRCEMGTIDLLRILFLEKVMSCPVQEVGREGCSRPDPCRRHQCVSCMTNS